MSYALDSRISTRGSPCIVGIKVDWYNLKYSTVFRRIEFKISFRNQFDVFEFVSAYRPTDRLTDLISVLQELRTATVSFVCVRKTTVGCSAIFVFSVERCWLSNTQVRKYAHLMKYVYIWARKNESDLNIKRFSFLSIAFVRNCPLSDKHFKSQFLCNIKKVCRSSCEVPLDHCRVLTKIVHFDKS